MANNRLYLVNKRLGLCVYLARFPAFARHWDVIHGSERELQIAFDMDEERVWHTPDWELCDESNMPDGLKSPTHPSFAPSEPQEP